jgi:hypothetical protein
MLIESKNPEIYRQIFNVETGELILDLLKKYGLNTVESSNK